MNFNNKYLNIEIYSAKKDKQLKVKITVNLYNLKKEKYD